jgi:transcriptional regulator of acetoin/glycerol metabolism
MTSRVLFVDNDPDQCRTLEALARKERPAAVAAVADQRQGAGEAPRAADGLPDRNPAVRYGIVRLLDERGEIRRFEAVEEELIRFALDHYRGHISEAARRLGVGRSTLYRKLRDYGIGADGAASL